MIFPVPIGRFCEVFLFTWVFTPPPPRLQHQVFFSVTFKLYKKLQVFSKGSLGHKMLKLVYFRSKGQVTLSQQIAPKILVSKEGNSAKSASANCTAFAH